MFLFCISIMKSLQKYKIKLNIKIYTKIISNYNTISKLTVCIVN